MQNNHNPLPPSGILHSIERCRKFSDLNDFVLKPIAERLNAEAGVFFQFAWSQNHPVGIERSDRIGAFEDAAELYSQGLFRDDPLLFANSETPVTFREIKNCMPAHFPDLDYEGYSKYLLNRFGMGDIIGFNFLISCGSIQKIATLTFPRQAGSPNYDEEASEILASLAPYLRLIISNLIKDEALRSYEEMMFALLSRQNEMIRSSSPRSGRSYTYGANGISHASQFRDRLGTRNTEPNLAGCTGISLEEQASLALENVYSLTQREMEVARALRQGHSNPSMSHALGISVRTVENHLRSIYAKLGVNSRTQALIKLTGH